MLAYYSSLIKKEELMERISLDAEQVASIANDLVCDIKTAAAASKGKDVETLLDSLDKAKDLIKVINAMLDNLKSNSVSYVNALLPQQIQEQEQKNEEPVKEIKKESAPEEQLVTLVETLRSLKEMQESISK
jgi:hypothetical protein